MASVTTSDHAPGHSKIQSLESLRGLAALIVVVQHLRLTFWRESDFDGLPPLVGLWSNASFAVRLFFVLSGFVLSRSFFLTGEIRVLRSAAARRFFRLSVPAAASVLFAYILCAGGAMAHHEVADRVLNAPNLWLHSFYMVPLNIRSAFREAFFGAYFDFQYTTSLNVVLWTMAVELQGSFFIFSALALFGTARHRYVVYAVMILILDGIQAKYLVDFVAGMAICDWHCKQGDNQVWNAVALPLFVVGLCLGDLHKEWLEGLLGPALSRGSRWWPTLAAACTVIGAIRSKAVGRALNVQPIVALGTLSFSLYLFHLPVICSVGAHAYLRLIDLNCDHNTSAVVASAMSIAASLVVSWLGATYLDSAALRLGRRFDNCIYSDIETVQYRTGRPVLGETA